MAEWQLLPRGVYPTLVTPFKASEAGAEIDFPALQRLVDWQYEQGVAGIFSPCQSSEMFELSPSERLSLACAAKEASRGRGPVLGVAGFGASVEEQAASCRQMAAAADYVVVVASLVCDASCSDDVWRERVRRLLDLCPGVRFGLYECPAPYHRLLTPELLKWCANTGRFYFLKDTCCSEAGIDAKLDALRSCDPHPLRFYNANVATLLHSLRSGGDGFSGISCNFYPGVLSGLCAPYCGGARARSRNEDRVQALLSVMENTVVDLYPRSAKEYLSLAHRDLGVRPLCRVLRAPPNEEQLLKIRALHSVASVAGGLLGAGSVGAQL